MKTKELKIKVKRPIFIEVQYCTYFAEDDIVRMIIN